jgi:hypothetical protein
MIEAIVGLIGMGVLAVFGWAYNQNTQIHSRISVLEADKVSLRELINVHFNALELRLERIERKLDKE